MQRYISISSKRDWTRYNFSITPHRFMVTIFGYIDVYFNLWNLKIVFLRYVILMNSFSWLLLLFWLMTNLHGFSAISESKIFISCVLRGVKFRSNVNPKWNPKKCIIWLSLYANRKCHPDKKNQQLRSLSYSFNKRTNKAKLFLIQSQVEFS